MTTTSAAVAKQDNGPGALIRQYRDDFATVLPSHIKADTWTRLAQGVLRRDKNLARIATQNPGSLMQALLECARLGHEPGTESFYLVPMGNEIEGWEGYRGVIERMYRAGGVTSVKVELVYTNDTFRYDPATMDRPEHTVDWFGDRGDILGAYAYAQMAGGGTSQVVIIDQAYLAKVRKESRGSDKPTSPWVKWPESMVRKTAIHRLEPFVPTSSEYREALTRQSAKPDEVPPAVLVEQVHPEPAPDVEPEVDYDTGEIVDVEVVDPDEPTWPEAAKPGSRGAA